MVSREAVLDKARSWLGMTERTGNNDIWFAEDWGISGYAWCFAFVQSCFYYADPSPSGKLPYLTMYVPAGVIYARDNGQAIEVGQGSPLPGDIVFFSWNMATWGRWTPGTGHHVELLESYDGGNWVNTIGGNVGDPDGVYRFTRPLDEVICFWRPSVYGGGPLAAAQQEDDMFEQPDRQMMTEVRDMLAKSSTAKQFRVAETGKVWMVWGGFRTPLDDENLRGWLMTVGILQPPDAHFEIPEWVLAELAVVTPENIPIGSQDFNQRLGNLEGLVWTVHDVLIGKVPGLVSATPQATPPAVPDVALGNRVAGLELRLAGIEQAIARLAGPRPPVASPTTPTVTTFGPT